MDGTDLFRQLRRIEESKRLHKSGVRKVTNPKYIQKHPLMRQLTFEEVERLEKYEVAIDKAKLLFDREETYFERNFLGK